MGNIPINESYVQKPKAASKLPTITMPDLSGALAASSKKLTELSAPKASPAANQPAAKPYVNTVNPNAGSPITMPQASKDFTAGLYNIPAGQAVSTTNERRLPIPEGTTYQGMAPSDQAYILNFPDGMGQKIVDPTNPDYTFKMNRPEFEPTAESLERQLLLGNRSPKLYEIDHVIPLWAGGTNNIENLEVLRTGEHRNKTKVQAVVLTLLASGDIKSEKEALTLAMDWQNLDRADIPRPFTKETNPSAVGLVPIEVAREKYAVWKNDKAKGRNPNIKTPSMLDVMRDPEFAKNYGEKAIPDWVPFKDTIREIAKGATSGMTAGWFPYVPDDDTNGLQKVAGMAGLIGASFIPIIGLGKGVAATGMFSKSASAAAKSGLLGKTAQKVAAATEKNAEQILSPKLAALRMRSKQIHPDDTDMWKTVSTLIGGGAVYGQLSPQGIAGKIAGEEDARPVRRLIEDITYGGLGAFVSGNLKGTVGVGMGVFGLSMFFDRNDPDPKQAAINSLIMMGLHANSYPAMKRRIEQVNQWNDNVNTAAAHSIFTGALGGKRFPEIKAFNPPKQGASVYNPARIRKLQEEAHAAVENMPIDVHTKKMWHNDVDLAARQLSKRGATIEARQKMDGEDLELHFKLAELDDEVLNRGRVIPNEVKVLEKALSKEIVDNQLKGARITVKPGTFYQKQDGEWLTGHFPSTGPGVSNLAADGEISGSLKADVIDFVAQQTGAAKKNPGAAPVVIGIRVPGQEGMNRLLNANMSQADIAAKLKKPMDNPDNTIELYGVFYGPNGSIKLKPVGYVPRKWSYNEKAEGINKNAKRPYKFDEEMNKDKWALAMDKNDLDFIVLKADVDYDASGVAHFSKEPYLTLVADDDHLEKSKALTRIFRERLNDRETRKTVLTDTIWKSRFPKSTAALKRANKIIRDTIEEPADEVLEIAMKDMPVDVNAQAAVTFFKGFRTALAEAESAQALKATMAERGIALLDDEAAKLFNKRSEVSVSDVATLLNKVSGDGRFIGQKGSALETIYTEFVTPFFMETSSPFRSWPMRNAFGDLKLLGNKVDDVLGTSAAVPVPGTRKPIFPSARTLRRQEREAAKQRPVEGLVENPEAQILSMGADEATPPVMKKAEKPIKLAQSISNKGADRLFMKKAAKPEAAKPKPVEAAQPAPKKTNWLEGEPRRVAKRLPARPQQQKKDPPTEAPIKVSMDPPKNSDAALAAPVKKKNAKNWGITNPKQWKKTLGFKNLTEWVTGKKKAKTSQDERVMSRAREIHAERMTPAAKAEKNTIDNLRLKLEEVEFSTRQSDDGYRDKLIAIAKSARSPELQDQAMQIARDIYADKITVGHSAEWELQAPAFYKTSRPGGIKKGPDGKEAWREGATSNRELTDEGRFIKAMVDDEFGFTAASDRGKRANEPLLSNLEALRRDMVAREMRKNPLPKIGDEIERDGKPYKLTQQDVKAIEKGRLARANQPFLDIWDRIKNQGKEEEDMIAYVPKIIKQKKELPDRTKDEWDTINKGAEERGRKVYEEMIAAKDTAEEGSYERTKALFMIDLLKKAKVSGDRYSERDLYKALDPMGATNQDKKPSGYIGSVLKSEDAGKTQPTELMKSYARRSQEGAEEIKRARGDEEVEWSMQLADLKDAQALRAGRGADAPAFEDGGGVYADDTIVQDGISGEDLDMLNIESPIQRADDNIPVESPIETLQAGLTRAIYAGDDSLLTPQAGMADAAAEVYAIIKAINAKRKGVNRISLRPADVNDLMVEKSKELANKGFKITEHKTIDDIVEDQARLAQQNIDVDRRTGLKASMHPEDAKLVQTILTRRKKVLDAYKNTTSYKRLLKKSGEPASEEALYKEAMSYGGWMWNKKNKDPKYKFSAEDEGFYKLHEGRRAFDIEHAHEIALIGENRRLMEMNELDADKVAFDDAAPPTKGLKTLEKVAETVQKQYEAITKKPESGFSIGAYKSLAEQIKNKKSTTPAEKKFVKTYTKLEGTVQRVLKNEMGPMQEGNSDLL